MFHTLSYMTLLCSLLLHIYLRLYCFVLFTESRGFLYNVFCAGGVDKENPLNPKDNRENGVMAFFRDGVGPILNKAWFKTLVMLIFFGYLAVSAWGVTQLREGLERRKLSRYDSYSVTFYDTDDKYFREYPYRVNVSSDFFPVLTTLFWSKVISLDGIVSTLPKRLVNGMSAVNKQEFSQCSYDLKRFSPD